MTELLIVRAGEFYVRFRQEGHELCSFAKASVFPLADEDLVRRRLMEVRAAGMKADLRKLTITEEAYGE